MNIVVGEVKEVANLLIGGWFGAPTADVVIQACELFAIAPVGLMATEQRLRKARCVLNDELQLLEAGGVGEKTGSANASDSIAMRRSPSFVDMELRSIPNRSARRTKTEAETDRWLFSIWFI